MLTASIVLDALQRTGHWEDTIIVLTSDHGYLLGEKFMWGKVMLFETCDRVPLVIRVPASVKLGQTKAGSSSEGRVELVDLFPTLAQLCDVMPPEELQGRSIAAMLSDPTAVGKEIAYTVVVRGSQLGKAIRTGQWHYTLWPDDSEELYNLNADPNEDNNLARSPEDAETIKSMRGLLDRAESAAKSRQR